MTTTTATASQHAPVLRFARFGTFGFRGSRPGQSSTQHQPGHYNDAVDTDWVIPYHGPIEPPSDVLVGRREGRDSWAGLVISDSENDGFERYRGGSVTGHGHGGASTSGHGHHSSQDHGHDRMARYEDRERGRVTSPISKYSDSVSSTFGAGGAGGEKHLNVLGSPTISPASPRRGPVPSFLQLDTGGVGMSPVPTQRIGHTSVPGHDGPNRDRVLPPSASPALSPRESHASFWTFGRSGSKKSPPAQAGATRPSLESRISRRSTSSRQTGPTDGFGMRERSATVTEPASISRPHRPRAYTAALSVPSATSLALHPRNFPPTVIEPDTSSSNESYRRHPYASALPPTGHRQASQLMQPSSSALDPRQQPPIPPQKRNPNSPSLGVPFLSPSRSINSLKRSAKSLKASVSTPNLRPPPTGRKHVANGSSSADAPSTPSATSTGTKWLSAETWCDALLFPRPRFRMRAAHVISPPVSPTEYGPPQSAPPQAERLRKTSLVGVDLKGKQAAPSAHPGMPSSTMPGYAVHPPPLEQPQPGPSKKVERPPRPKSFAQDDLAIPSPVPSLATYAHSYIHSVSSMLTGYIAHRVLKQNEAFDKERDEWKAKAARSFGNKRSRSLSRSRVRGKMKQMQDDRESELATSFGMIAASAFTGNQTLKPTLHFAHTPAASRAGVGTTTATSTALTGRSSHSRNASGTSHTGGHSRKESWSKTALNAAKSTANATGLCNFHQDMSPADEKVMILDPMVEKDRSRNVAVRPPVNEPESGDDVIAISPQKTLYRVPSHQSYASTSHSGVGIAVSTPTALVDSSFQISGHPFAAGTAHGEPIPRASDYAGPHPSKKAEHSSNELSVSDVNFPHPLLIPTDHPSSLHPLSAYEQRSRRPTRIPSHSISPSSKMFADIPSTGIREVYPDEIQYSPYSSRHPGSSSRNSAALGVEEALNVAFSSRSDSQTEDENMDVATDDPDKQFHAEPGAQELVVPPLARTGSYRPLLMPQIDELRESWQTSPDEDPTLLRVRHDSSTTPNSTVRARTSPGMMSIESSPMTSPRQFKKFDDMEDYSDIFYRAPEYSVTNSNDSSARPTPPQTTSRAMNISNDGSDPAEKAERPVLSRSNSALTNLKRQLSQKYIRNMEAERQLPGEDTGLSRHVDDDAGGDEGNIDEVHTIASQSSSPPGATLPLRAAMPRPESSGPAHLIPEDVVSSRTSSILDRYEGEDGNGECLWPQNVGPKLMHIAETEVIYRVKEVPALATPPIHQPHLISESRHGSYIGASFNPSTADRQASSPSPDFRSALNTLVRPSYSSQSGSLKPPPSVSSATRASYLTSTSSSSRISESQLSNFPAPPGQNSLTPGAIIQSYFGSPDTTERADPMAERESRAYRIPFPVNEDEEYAEDERRREARQSRRTTFGTIPYDSS